MAGKAQAKNKKTSSAKKKTPLKLASTKAKVPVEVKEEKVTKTTKTPNKAKKYENKIKNNKPVKKEKKTKEKTEKQLLYQEKVAKERKIKEKEAKKEDKVEVVKKEKKDVKKQLPKTEKKKLSKLSKVFIALSIICVLIICVEGILFVINKKKIDDKNIYSNTLNGVTYDDNDVIVVGASDFHYNKKIKNEDGNSHGRIVRYDESGDIVFEKMYHKGISTEFNDVITVSDGYIVVGTGIFSEEELENEGKEAMIVKYDTEGNVVWEKFYGVLTNTGFNKVIATSDGYIAIGQSIYANMEIGTHTTGGGIIVKYDKEGNLIWHSNHGGTKSGNFNDIVQVGTDYYVVGKDGADCANIVKFNAKGEYQWHKNYKYTDSFGFSGLVYKDNYLYVVGSKKILPEGTGDEDDRSTTNTDALLVKYDLNGNIVWEKVFGGSSFERYNDIIIYGNNLYAIGHLCSKDAGLKLISTVKDKMSGFIIKYDFDGNITKKEVYGGSNDDNLLALTSDGYSIYIVGYSDSKDGNLVTSKDNGKDYFGKLIKLNNKLKIIFKK